MLIQPEKIVLLDSDDDQLEADAVPLPSGSIVHFMTNKGWFRFLQENGSLSPRCKDGHVLSTLLNEAMQKTPGAGAAHYNLVNWIASSRLRNDAQTVVSKDLFTTTSELSVFAVGVAEEVELGPIYRMRVFTP